MSVANLIMERNGVMPMPPPRKTTGVLGSSGRTKLPLAPRIGTSVFGGSCLIAFLKVELGSANLVVNMMCGSVGEEERVKCLVTPRSSGLS